MNSEIKQALQSLNIPVNFRYYSGNDDKYITFFAYDEKDENYSDDEAEAEGYYPQVDLWIKTKEDYTQLKKQVKLAMQNAGYTFTNGDDMYEDNTGISHIAMRFFKVNELI